jgi:alanine-glyoxylate transaminase/serine-glyoxylate transaminase/serine-pyruvate transaminase
VNEIQPRLLLGSGPSPVPQRVLDALAQPTIGHLDPQFGAIMDEVSSMLRMTFQTSNPVTFPLSATGSGGMQAMVDTLIAPGDRVVCGVHGLFGERMADALGRAGAKVIRVEAQWGRALDRDALAAAMTADTRALFVVHGETSTGVAQPLDGLREIAGEALLLVDCVTSLAGHPLNLDAAGADAAFSGTQKCLNCPPGLAPFTVSLRATEHLQRRSWYFDLEAILGYWISPDQRDPPTRTYHHTAPINMIYALHEALTIVGEEGLEARWARHATAHEALRAALAELSFERLALDGEQLHPLLCAQVPPGIDEAAIRGRLLSEHGIEVSGGLGPLAGRVWRIGVMGEGARFAPQAAFVEALAKELGADASHALEALASQWG